MLRIAAPGTYAPLAPAAVREVATNIMSFDLSSCGHQWFGQSLCLLNHHSILCTYEVLLLDLDAMVVNKYWSVFWAFPAVFLWILILRSYGATFEIAK